MGYGYTIAALASGTLSGHHLQAVLPMWLACILGFCIACLVIFLGIMRAELAYAEGRDSWLREGERRTRPRRNATHSQTLIPRAPAEPHLWADREAA